MFEHFLERLSVSDYSEKFVVKGGMLIADVKGIIKQISSSADLNDMWVKYQKKYCLGSVRLNSVWMWNLVLYSKVRTNVLQRYILFVWGMIYFEQLENCFAWKIGDTVESDMRMRTFG